MSIILNMKSSDFGRTSTSIVGTTKILVTWLSIRYINGEEDEMKETQWDVSEEPNQSERGVWEEQEVWKRDHIIGTLSVWSSRHMDRKQFVAAGSIPRDCNIRIMYESSKQLISEVFCNNNVVKCC